MAKHKKVGTEEVVEGGVKAEDLEIISIGSLYEGPWQKKYWSSSRVRFPLLDLFFIFSNCILKFEFTR